MKNKKIFTGSSVDTKTYFNTDGSIDIFPQAEGSRRKKVTNNGSQVVQKGRTVTCADGKSRFVPYKSGTGQRYTELWTERYGRLKMSKTRLVLKVSVPLDIDDPIGEIECIADMLKPNNTDSHVIERIKEAISKLDY